MTKEPTMRDALEKCPFDGHAAERVYERGENFVRCSVTYTHRGATGCYNAAPGRNGDSGKCDKCYREGIPCIIADRNWNTRAALSHKGGEERARELLAAELHDIGEDDLAVRVRCSPKRLLPKHAVAALDAIQAALSTSEGWAIGWQGIETAPKDGTLILLHTGTHVVLARWTITSSRDTLNDTEHGGGDVRANFTREYGWRSASEKDLSGKVFKYWSPIPSPPTPETGDPS